MLREREKVIFFTKAFIIPTISYDYALFLTGVVGEGDALSIDIFRIKFFYLFHFSTQFFNKFFYRYILLAPNSKLTKILKKCQVNDNFFYMY